MLLSSASRQRWLFPKAQKHDRALGGPSKWDSDTDGVFATLF